MVFKIFLHSVIINTHLNSPMMVFLLFQTLSNLFTELHD